MKKILLPVAIIAIMASCNNAPEADKATASEKETAAQAEGITYVIDSSSTVNWHATKANGEHTGLFSLQTGSLAEKDGSLTGGSFVIDVASLQNVDMAATLPTNKNWKDI